ncbi:phosphoribosylformylglycinamidine synthase subunit II [Rhodothalassium salexigens DSM 2132]|uniref:Phosphoribosylformylglycinamidine synthase subunit PurL n=1 Tax=Rhodothalassium salexigens DSM 2132 TaxID=1188247 RepID=A0A4R2PS93_RHOSA|nr:phosphoribosylformylglycinamidine synthase subunit PurL [Rhodothalassium salexigens]MBB4210625.1 phosphoribosylformylglycinamidine synthase [Rhodothalassium salexigens DSM 2132]MBK1639061.1 phosphoribosylformylglycinamidine synthase II [Rhodothalassium salexigens DSM 2132]TCP37818.1 phosphoribosylformylglycinamidine synthase subunit II [Rhodothalassium salexigens DSM 2132]
MPDNPTKTQGAQTPVADTPTEPAVTADLAAEHGLNAAEYDRVLATLGRTPTLTELGLYSVMWSEHCSYKSSRRHLKKLPTSGPQVIQGPGENAGVVDIGNGQAAIFKMESHNHPSFIEPYQGAATGVGGILRDVFTMGARPVALLNALSFGAPDHAKTQHLVSGVVAGIGGYGNCVGVPTVGGETRFHSRYNGNILVNAMAVGLADADKIFYSAAAGVGNPVVYVGAKTGRDGIHGATMASAEFSEDSAEKRPTVQVGDPFTEKLLIEACLELMATDAIVAIQDMGAAGLTSSSAEMAGKGGVGIRLDLDRVPTREDAMTAYEMMLSESQERMLMVLKPGREDQARAIFEKWELDFAVIGALTDTGRMTLVNGGRTVADVPLDSLTDDAPNYDRPHVPSEPRPLLRPDEVPAADDMGQAILDMVGAPDLASRRWIWEQYDHTVMGDTIARPGGDAAIVRVHGTNKGLALTADCTPRYCEADPFEGGKQAVAETWRNLSAVGAEPLAVTDCLNFGNPERPEIMGQFVGCIEGMAQACEALGYPVVSGNVSLYNETEGQAILPTPTLGGVGLIRNLDHRASPGIKRAGDAVFLLGETRGHLGASLYAAHALGHDAGAPPPVDLDLEMRAGGLVRQEIALGRLDTVHDLSDGGLAEALATLMLAGDGYGLDVRLPNDPDGQPLAAHAALFGEDQGRYLVCLPADRAEAFAHACAEARVPVERIGDTVAGPQLAIAGVATLALDDLRAAHERFLPTLMA